MAVCLIPRSLVSFVDVKPVPIIDHLLVSRSFSPSHSCCHRVTVFGVLSLVPAPIEESQEQRGALTAQLEQLKQKSDQQLRRSADLEELMEVTNGLIGKWWFSMGIYGI